MEESIKRIFSMKSSMKYREYIEILKKLKEKNFHQEYMVIYEDIKAKGERNGKSR